MDLHRVRRIDPLYKVGQKKYEEKRIRANSKYVTGNVSFLVATLLKEPRTLEYLKIREAENTN